MKSMKADSSNLHKKGKRVKSTVEELLKTPTFSSVPKSTLEPMLHTLEEPTEPLLPSGSAVFLYDGARDGKSTSEEFEARYPQYKGRVFSYDIQRGLDEDILGSDLWSLLVYSMAYGRIDALLAGPNCRSWSVLRQRVKKPFKGQVRARDNPWVAIDPGTKLDWTKNPTYFWEYSF